VDAADFEREARTYTAASRERDALSQVLGFRVQGSRFRDQVQGLRAD
jgi:hypothetical protein